ncbi:uncharacterized protein LOC116707077 isoform X2 [Etheostoma spectabile]|uniref:uncharacterized protein LOC116707077 isoform X2 n=1 Tax=Etheostoma spectabile TaxID=54343 RepID=UPI0013AF2852|nr:uncharacterized protein LOC116707077 isoform X2 [Etheostoma spectabile]
MIKRRMRNFTLIKALLLWSLSWISVSVSEYHTEEGQSGKPVTLMCSNISKTPTLTEWFRLINRTKPSCVSAMYGSDGKASFCEGFQNRFEMISNISTVFLKINSVNFSDSGLYFCGFNQNNNTVLVNATYLKVQEESDGTTKVMSVILGALTVFLTIVILVLAVKIRKLQTAVNEELQPERNQDLGSDELNYAALNFQAQPKRSRRPAPERKLEPHVVYSATR